ncbi:MAG: glycerophosphodiester phosphodiesterase family protein [Candidatus Devosia euplotis]|nr:glycerophosphodiester phosphodiesterase family protein [Candidatus Devosia euplotis]
MGADIVEIDVCRSADGHLFLMHDDTLLRMAGIDRDAETFTMAELQAITLRADDGGDGRELGDQHIPTLEQALEIIRGRIFADLDLKDRAPFPEVAACTRAMRAASWVDPKTTVMTDQHVDWIRSQNIADVPFMAMVSFTCETVPETLSVLARLKLFMSEIRFDNLDAIAANRAAFEASGMALWKNTPDQANSGSWTDTTALDDPDLIWGRLIDASISAIQADQPQALKAYLESRRRLSRSTTALWPA